MGEISLTGDLVARGPAAAFVLDDEQVAAVGEGAKRFPVIATVNGYTWRTSVARMGGEFLVGLNKEVRTGAGVQAGDTVSLELKLDSEPRTVEVPAALAEALDADPEAKATFEGSRLHPPQGVRALDRGGQARGDPRATRDPGGGNDPHRPDPQLTHRELAVSRLRVGYASSNEV